MNEPIRDIHGREIRHGDLVRIFHYIDGRTKRNVYLHKLVVRDSGVLTLVDVVDIAKSGFAKAHRCVPSGIECEIIDGLGVFTATEDGTTSIECWYERPKVKNERATGDA